MLRIYGALYPLHRLIWLYVYGSWPTGQIDHINRDRGDNRIENLREATPTQNKANTPAQRNNRHGAKGVTWSEKDKRWHARIQVNGRRKFLGGFKTHQEAAHAYAKAADEAFGPFANMPEPKA